MLTYDQLVEELHYDQITGIFTRKKSCKGRKENAIVGSKRKDGYLTTSFRRKFFYIHRLAWFYIYKEWPNGLIDHINGIKSDNRIDNLRIVTHSQNLQNSKKHIDNASGYKCVWKHSETKWRSGICFNGKIKYLGLFDDPQSAYQAYLSASKIYHTHNSNKNV